MDTSPFTEDVQVCLEQYKRRSIDRELQKSYCKYINISVMIKVQKNRGLTQKKLQLKYNQVEY